MVIPWHKMQQRLFGVNHHGIFSVDKETGKVRKRVGGREGREVVMWVGGWGRGEGGWVGGRVGRLGSGRQVGREGVGGWVSGLVGGVGGWMGNREEVRDGGRQGGGLGDL